MTNRYDKSATVRELFPSESAESYLARSPEAEEGERRIAQEALRISLQRDGDID